MYFASLARDRFDASDFRLHGLDDSLRSKRWVEWGRPLYSINNWSSEWTGRGFARSIFLRIANDRSRHLHSFPEPDSNKADVHPDEIVIGDDEPEINANNSEDIRTIIDAEVWGGCSSGWFRSTSKRWMCAGGSRTFADADINTIKNMIKAKKGTKPRFNEREQLLAFWNLQIPQMILTKLKWRSHCHRRWKRLERPKKLGTTTMTTRTLFL